MAGLNKVTLIGNLGHKPEMRYTPDGVAVTDFSLAVTDGKREADTVWFRVSCWRALGELVNTHLDKGRQVYVEGRLRHRTYKKQDGSDGCGLDVIADKVVFLGRKSEGPAGAASANGAIAGTDNGWPGDDEGGQDLAELEPPPETTSGAA